MSLELRNTSFGFNGDNLLLKDISIVLEDRKIYALMGANGSGKTTLLNLMSGFYKTLAGKIIFDNKPLNGLQPYKINLQGIGRTFQDLRLITKLTVKENIILAMKNNPSDKWYNSLINFKEDIVEERKPEKIADRFFLNDVLTHLAGEISYGQQKLLSLACCVANAASLILLDEPVAGIQPEYRNKIATLINQLKEQGKTILLIEHNTDFIEDVADKIFFLNEGQISVFENIESLRKDKQVMEAYM